MVSDAGSCLAGSLIGKVLLVMKTHVVGER